MATKRELSYNIKMFLSFMVNDIDQVERLARFFKPYKVAELEKAGDKARELWRLYKAGDCNAVCDVLRLQHIQCDKFTVQGIFN